MGNEKSKLLLELNDLLKKVGWSQKTFAEVVYEELYEDDDEDGFRRFFEKIKKSVFQRGALSEGELKKYIEICYRHPDVLKFGEIKLCYVENSSLSESAIEKMRKISCRLDQNLIENFYSRLDE